MRGLDLESLFVFGGLIVEAANLITIVGVEAIHEFAEKVINRDGSSIDYKQIDRKRENYWMLPQGARPALS